MTTSNIVAENLPEDNSPQTYPAPCPACGQTVKYSVATHHVSCACGWSVALTATEAHDFLWAVAGICPLDLAAFLLALSPRNGCPAPRPTKTGKQVIEPRKGETVWGSLLRLGAQAAINGVRVTPEDDDYTAFVVTSQEPGQAPYAVSINHQVTCSCPRGAYQPGRACAHIGAVYAYLQHQAPATMPIVPPASAAPVPAVDKQAVAAAALAELYAA